MMVPDEPKAGFTWDTQKIVLLLVMLLQAFQTWAQQNTNGKVEGVHATATQALDQTRENARKVDAVRADATETRRLLLAKH